MKNRTITIKLDAALFKQVTALMEERGTSLETYLRLQIRALSRSKTNLGLRDKMPYGKYSGEIIEDVVRTDPRYMNWAVANVTGTKLAMEVLELLEELNENSDGVEL